jgi:hypothetical protein
VRIVLSARRQSRRVGFSHWQLKPRLSRGFFATRAPTEKRVPPMRREGAAVEASAASGAVASVALAEAQGNSFPVMAASTGGVKPDRKIRWIKA